MKPFPSGSKQALHRESGEEFGGFRLFRLDPPPLLLLPERFNHRRRGFVKQRRLEVIKKGRAPIPMPAAFFTYLRGNLRPILSAMADQEFRDRDSLAGSFSQGYFQPSIILDDLVKFSGTMVS